MTIRVDGNEGYDVEAAIRLARAIAPYRIALLEQPIPRKDLEGLARIRRAIDIPVMADEAIEGLDTLVSVIRLEAADIVKVKVMKQGGLLRCLRAIDMAEAAGIRCVIGHGFGLTLNTLAELHVAAVSANVLDGCECVGPTKLTGDVVAAPLVMETGRVAVPTAPGLGASLDDAALARWALPMEMYSPERKAAFLLENAIDPVDYERARDEVRRMGLDPDRIPHSRPSA